MMCVCTYAEKSALLPTILILTRTRGPVCSVGLWCHSFPASPWVEVIGTSGAGYLHHQVPSGKLT